MANYNEQMLAYAWLQSTLGSDSTLAGFAPGGVWRALAPNAEATPFVITSHQAGHDVLNTYAYRIMVDMTFQVYAIGPQSSEASIISAAARIDALLGAPPGRAAGGNYVTISATNEGWMYAIWREQPLVMDEIVNGEVWTRVGGLYRCQLGQIAS